MNTPNPPRADQIGHADYVLRDLLGTDLPEGARAALEQARSALPGLYGPQGLPEGEAMTITVRSTVQHRHDPEWRDALVASMTGRNVEVVDVGGGSGLNEEPEALCADNDYTLTGTLSDIADAIDAAAAFAGSRPHVWTDDATDVTT